MLNQKTQDNKKTYTVAEIADMLNIGRTSAYMERRNDTNSIGQM